MLPACWLITLLLGGGKSKLSTAMSPPAGQSENHFTEAMDLNLSLTWFRVPRKALAIEDVIESTLHKCLALRVIKLQAACYVLSVYSSFGLSAPVYLCTLCSQLQILPHLWPLRSLKMQCRPKGPIGPVPDSQSVTWQHGEQLQLFRGT